MADVDLQRFEAAGARFVLFFNELGRAFVEREELLAQVALALLSREHVLMTGPPGTAKSGIASAVLRRVVDEKTGQPSLFARQFTESTVQTDLVGPINFKTLMETGRTEHFTDEGMLGAVHAFLDEVFDGRDMLLRSTLNVLQERELKQGTKTTRGAIECALMTTNRYLAEVLESSRETLLAFVDRVAFVAFVPKGFATTANLSNVLRKQVGGTGTPRLTEALTIQDLDALQAATESVYVPDAICDQLANLLGLMDDELGAAERADPQFMATRYLSTRTAVRSGRILRAVCVYDKLFFDKDRALEVNEGDLKALRLSILLAGPVPESLGALIARETDPRERRQLSIIRTEREVFERCLSKLKPIRITPRKKAPPKAAPSSKRAALQAHDKLSSDKLVELARSGAPDDVRAAVEELVSRAMIEGVRAASGMHDSVGESVAALVAVADAVEKVPGETMGVARWTRGRALMLLDEAVSLVENNGAVASLVLEAPAGLDAVANAASQRVAQLERLFSHRAQIRALGADEDDAQKSDDLWRRAAARAEDDVCAILDVGFRKDAASAFASPTRSGGAARTKGGDDLGTVLNLLAAPLAILDRVGKELAAVGAPGNVKGRVVAPRILPLVNAAFEHTNAPDRQKLVAEVDAILDVLDEHQLRAALAPRDLLAGAARALMRVADKTKLPAHPAALDREHYRKLRSLGQRVPGAYTLLEIAMRVAPKRTLRSTANPEAAVAAVHEIARSLPADVASAVAQLDVARLEATATFLEMWFDSELRSASSPEEKLQEITTSGYFGVAFEEQALLRTALEARVVGDVFPECAAEVVAIRGRLEALRDRAHGELEGLFQRRADEAWATVLASPTS